VAPAQCRHLDQSCNARRRQSSQPHWRPHGSRHGVEQVESSGFGWTDAAIGALFGIGLAAIAGYAATTLHGRRSDIALGA
jgi:hypothetical protein